MKSIKKSFGNVFFFAEKNFWQCIWSILCCLYRIRSVALHGICVRLGVINGGLIYINDCS